jgi:hypothetical protein
VPEIVLLCSELKMDWVRFYRHCISTKEFENEGRIMGMRDRWHTSARSLRVLRDIWSESEMVEEIPDYSRDKSLDGREMPEISRIPSGNQSSCRSPWMSLTTQCEIRFDSFWSMQAISGFGPVLEAEVW